MNARWFLLLALLAVWLGGCQAVETPTAVPVATAVQAPTVRPVATPTLAPTVRPSPLPTLALGRATGLPKVKIDRHPKAAAWSQGPLAAVPTYDPDADSPYQVDLRSADLSALDLSESLPHLVQGDFDTRTVWPPGGRMPPGFDPAQIMELGKNPGLGIRSLHERGITGRGVAIAIVDQPLLIEHREYAGRIRLYEEINVAAQTPSQMHGPAVASIAVGKTVGVAPEASLYYIATWAFRPGAASGPRRRDFAWYAQAVRRILEVNRQLPEGQKIRAISLSVGWGADEAGYDEITAATQEAREAGLLVVSSSIEQTHGFRIHGLGRDPLADPDRVESYGPGLFWARDFPDPSSSTGRLMAPMDSRTVASFSGAGDYAFYRAGGWSWITPYIAGVYALAAQVDPAITPDRFWQLALETGHTVQCSVDGRTGDLGPILDPVALVEALAP